MRKFKIFHIGEKKQEKKCKVKLAKDRKEQREQKGIDWALANGFTGYKLI